MRRTDYIQKKPATRKVRYNHAPYNSCFVCGSNLEQISTDNRNLTNLEEKQSVSIQVSRCKNEECTNHKKRLKPLTYLQQIVPQSGYGIDVYSKIGDLRISSRCTVTEIHQKILRDYPHIELTERHVENMVNTLLLCIAQSGKNASYLKSYFAKRSQKQLQLTIDGVQPEQGHSILYIVREVVSGKILFAHYSTYSDAKSLEKEIIAPLKSVLEQADLEVAGWTADKELAISKAVLAVYKDTPFQHCQAHFLGAMKKPLTHSDTQLGKTVKKTLVNCDLLNAR